MFLEIITIDPSVYTIDHPGLTVSNFMGKSISPKGLIKSLLYVTDSGSIHKVALKKFSKHPKDPAIQEGKALPDNGACKHYKKSYRWLR